MPDLIIAGLIQFQLIVKRISTSVCNIVWSIVRLICKTTAAAASTTTHTNRIRVASQQQQQQQQHRPNEGKMINKTYKLLFGIVLLLIVDIIWVSSSELTKFLYQNEEFDKPFFCTYFKTSMFTLYLLVLGLIAPWKNSNCDPNRNNYTLVDQNVEDENFFSNGNTLSDSTYVPIKNGSGSGVGVSSGNSNGNGTGGHVSGTESDDSSIRSVRFSKLAEVREMSPHDATEALMSRLSYAASMRIRRQKTNHKTARTALMFCILWFIANYLFQLALEPNETALVLLLSSTSTFFTLILAAIYPSSIGDRFTLSKLIAVLCCTAGVVMVTIDDVQGPKMSKGVVLALLSAFFYASYLVLVKRKSDTEEKINIPLFFGFVGLWNLLLMWPIFFVLNFTQIELFELPNHRQFLVLFLNGLIGTVLSEALWLWSCFLTSSLIGTIAMTLQIPLAMLFDVIFKSKTYSSLFYLGTIPMCCSLFFVSFLMKNDDSDPLWRLIKIAYRKFCLCRRPNIVRVSDLDEQHESLISNYEN